MGFGFVLNLGRPKNQRKGTGPVPLKTEQQTSAILENIEIYAPLNQPAESHTPHVYRPDMKLYFRSAFGL